MIVVGVGVGAQPRLRAGVHWRYDEMDESSIIPVSDDEFDNVNGYSLLATAHGL